MKKILVLHQPFPMGNYKLMPYISNHLSSLGHDVYLLEQLNGRPISTDYIEYVKSQGFDSIYYEMLDTETFKLIESLKDVNRVLCYASKGIFSDFDEILKYSGVLYDKVLTNSKIMVDKFSKISVETEHFEYYPAPLSDDEITYDSKYTYDFVYLGGGFQRLVKSEYSLESKIIYNNPLVHKFGNGWSNVPNYMGLLPPSDIGKLYHSAKVSLATIEPSQRNMGMLNNRYSEIMKSGGKVLSLDYGDAINYFGAEEFIKFIHPNVPLEQYSNFKVDVEKQITFIKNKEADFFTKLINLI
jgi:hypothetical protein